MHGPTFENPVPAAAPDRKKAEREELERRAEALKAAFRQVRDLLDSAFSYKAAEEGRVAALTSASELLERHRPEIDLVLEDGRLLSGAAFEIKRLVQTCAEQLETIHPKRRLGKESRLATQAVQGRLLAGLAEHLPTFERMIGTKGHLSGRHEAMELLPLLIAHGDDEQALSGVETFRRQEKEYAVDVERDIADRKQGKPSGAGGWMAAHLIAYGTPERSETTAAMTAEMIRTTDFSKGEKEFVAGDILERLSRLRAVPAAEPPPADRLEALLEAPLGEAGLDAGECLRAWNDSLWLSEERIGKKKIIKQNVHAALSIEAKRPGAAALLRREFGVMDFGRYPEDLLLKQCETSDDPESPYGVLIVARDDHNGRLYGERETWSGLDKGLEDKYLLRVVECGSKQELARRLLQMDRRYGKSQKIGFALLFGHGSKDGVTLGSVEDPEVTGPIKRKSRPDQRIAADDLKGPGFRRGAGLLRPDAQIAVIACSTGAEGGFVDHVASELGHPAVGPAAPGNLSSIKPIFAPEGSVRFEIAFNWTEARHSEPGHGDEQG